MSEDTETTHAEAEADLLDAIRDLESLHDDDIHEYFEHHSPPGQWMYIADEALRLAKIVNAEGLLCEYTLETFLNALAAESYERGIAHAAAYLGVDRRSLSYGVALHQDEDCETRTGIVIPTDEALNQETQAAYERSQEEGTE